MESNTSNDTPNAQPAIVAETGGDETRPDLVSGMLGASTPKLLDDKSKNKKGQRSLSPTATSSDEETSASEDEKSESKKPKKKKLKKRKPKKYLRNLNLKNLNLR